MVQCCFYYVCASIFNFFLFYLKYETVSNYLNTLAPTECQLQCLLTLAQHCTYKKNILAFHCRMFIVLSSSEISVYLFFNVNAQVLKDVFIHRYIILLYFRVLHNMNSVTSKRSWAAEVQMEETKESKHTLFIFLFKYGYNLLYPQVICDNITTNTHQTFKHFTQKSNSCNTMLAFNFRF